jgi:hypothetical protein
MYDIYNHIYVIHILMCKLYINTFHNKFSKVMKLLKKMNHNVIDLIASFYAIKFRIRQYVTGLDCIAYFEPQ